MEIIRGSQYWIPESRITDVEVFKSKFTFTPKYKELKPVPTYTYAIFGGEPYYGFPRNWEDLDGHTIIDKTVTGEVNVEFLGELWDYQEPLILDFVEQVQQGATDLILSADTGSGKTVMLLKMWSILKVPALVIVPKSDLMDQWKDRIKKFTNCEDADIGVARQSVCEWEGKKIVVGMIHSLCKDRYPDAFKNYPGLVIFDELHKLGAFTFSQVGGMFPAKYRLGATATLRRADGLSRVFYAHLGENVIKPLRGDQPKPRIVVVKYPVTSGKIPHWANTKVKRRGVLLSCLANNLERNTWVSKLTSEVYSTGRQTLVLGERIHQLMDISVILQEEYGVPADDIGIYIGSTPAAKRKYIAENCKIILATTGMLALGTDIPTLRGLVFATPLADAEQATGRICRFCNDVSDPVVIDIVDTTYLETTRWHRGRLALYKKQNWRVSYA